MKQVLHYPRLDTVLMVERVLEEADEDLSRAELTRRLPKQVMHQTLTVILDYFENRGMIYRGEKGITWIHNDHPKMKALITKSRTVTPGSLLPKNSTPN